MVIAVFSGTLVAQTNATSNLATCLTGRYPALCNHDLLTFEQRRQVAAAETRENLSMCMTGNYPALCDHSKLSPSEAASVFSAERRENLKVCLAGTYPTLCKHDLLSTSELQQAQVAEREENLKLCMSGRYAPLCKHDLLTADQLRVVAAKESRAGATRPVIQANTLAGDCKTKHWIDTVSDNGKIIKLEDGSLWEVDPVDSITTAIWLPITDVVVCAGKMLNVDDDESAHVKPVRPLVSSSSGRNYIIESSTDDETFVINGEVFSAKTFCFGFDKGDKVVFLEGSALGACASAKILNLRNQKVCELWCE
jgi:hypothetical protein